MGSVHLQNFPDVSSFPNEKELAADMDKVRDCCNAILGIRNTENVRVRQPLSTATLYGEGSARLKKFADLIADEVNVKNVVFSEELEKVATKKLQVNFPILGKRLPEKMKQIIPASKQGQWKLAADGRVEICGEVLNADEAKLLLEPKDKKGAAPLSTNDALVVLDLNLTPELINEGLARDVVRLIQESRKNAKLNIADRITLVVETGEKLTKALEENKAYVEEQTLSAISFGAAKGQPHTAEGEIEGEKISLGFAARAGGAKAAHA